MTIHTTQESLKGKRTGVSLAVTQYSLLVDTIHNKYYISFRNPEVKQGLTCLIFDFLLIVIRKTPIPKAHSQGSLLLVSSERKRETLETRMRFPNLIGKWDVQRYCGSAGKSFVITLQAAAVVRWFLVDTFRFEDKNDHEYKI